MLNIWDVECLNHRPGGLYISRGENGRHNSTYPSGIGIEFLAAHSDGEREKWE